MGMFIWLVVACAMALIEVFTLPVEQIETFLRENTVPIGTRAQLILEAFVNAKQLLKQEG